MTLKHINFLDSEVLRNLEANHLEKQPRMMKRAEAPEMEISFEPSEDLFNDLVRLAEGLRRQGLAAQADELEQKLHLRQAAKKDLEKSTKDDGEKFLDMAHPEGDVEISPSKSGLGKVWTEQSAQKEIRRIVEKTPTGKQAKINEILNASKKALGQDVSDTKKTLEAIDMFSAIRIKPLLKSLNQDIDILNWGNDVMSFLSSDSRTLDMIAQKMLPILKSKMKEILNRGKDLTPHQFWTRVKDIMWSDQKNSSAWYDPNSNTLNVKNLFEHAVRKADPIVLPDTSGLAKKITDKYRAILSNVENIISVFRMQFENASTKEVADKINKDAYSYIALKKALDTYLKEPKEGGYEYLVKLFAEEMGWPEQRVLKIWPTLEALDENIRKVVDYLSKQSSRRNSNINKTSDSKNRTSLVEHYFGSSTPEKKTDPKSVEEKENPFKAPKHSLKDVDPAPAKNKTPKHSLKEDVDEKENPFAVPKRDKKTETETKTQPRPSASSYSPQSAPVVKMQQALIDLSKYLEKLQGSEDKPALDTQWYEPIGKISSHGRPDNAWGDLTDKALKQAQNNISVLNDSFDLGIRGNLHLEKSPANAKANADFLENALKIISNADWTRKGKGEDLGIYEIAGKSVKITDKDLGSLTSLLNMLAEYGLVQDVREGRTADQRAVTEASRKQEWKKLAQNSQFIAKLKEQDHEKIHSKNKPSGFDFDFDFSLPLGRWKKLLVDLARQGKMKFNQGQKSRSKVEKLSKLMDLLKNLYRRLEAAAKQQGADPQDPASSNVLISPGSRSQRGGQGLSGAGYPQDQDLEGRTVDTGEDIARIGKTLNLKADAWAMPPEYRQVIDWHDFNRTHATRLAARMFARITRSPRQAQERLIKLHGLQPMKYVKEDHMYRVYVRGKGVMRLDKALGRDYVEQLRQAQRTSAVREFQKFLSLLNRKISEVAYQFSEMEDNPQLINQANRWASRWEDVISRKYQETREALSSGELG